MNQEGKTEVVCTSPPSKTSNTTWQRRGTAFHVGHDGLGWADGQAGTPGCTSLRPLHSAGRGPSGGRTVRSERQRAEHAQGPTRTVKERRGRRTEKADTAAPADTETKPSGDVVPSLPRPPSLPADPVWTPVTLSSCNGSPPSPGLTSLRVRRELHGPTSTCAASTVDPTTPRSL